MEDLNIALLIDSDNVSSRYISGILSELSKYGKITIRRMYGDWSQDRLHSWMKCSSRYSLTPIMQPNNTPGKNASDIGLIIDAMDILYTGDVQGFCIVSSDGDFNKLATRLREAGKIVIGMGEKKTPESFRVSCERFIFLDVIDSENSGSSRYESASSAAESNSAGTAARSASAQSAARKKRTTASVAEPIIYKQITGPTAPPKVQEEPDADQDFDSDSDALFTDKATIENAIVSIITESLNVENRDNNVWVSLNSSSDSEIEQQILRIFKKHGTDDMYMTTLKKELTELNPNLEASIRRSGVTRFSVYLNRMISSVEVNGRHVLLKKG